MMKVQLLIPAVVLVLALSGCGGKKSVGLDVDLYLHPEAATLDDLLLQTAIQKRLNENLRTRSTTFHVRVIHLIVFLDGFANSADIVRQAINIAETTQVAVNGTTIQSKDPVKDGVRLEP